VTTEGTEAGVPVTPARETGDAAVSLSALADAAGARSPRNRVGRGPGSGRGKTSGRGMKGQKARSGVAIKGCEGGQMPLHRRLPKRGFSNGDFRKRPATISIGRMQQAVDAGRLDPASEIDTRVLLAAGLLRRAPDGVRVLADGSLAAALQLRLAGASKSALAAIERAGGSFTVASRSDGRGQDAKPAAAGAAADAAPDTADASPGADAAAEAAGGSD